MSEEVKDLRTEYIDFIASHLELAEDTFKDLHQPEGEGAQDILTKVRQQVESYLEVLKDLEA